VQSRVVGLLNQRQALLRIPYRFISDLLFQESPARSRPVAVRHTLPLIRSMKAEKRVADTYNALRSNHAFWGHASLVNRCDEHGGFSEHVHRPPFFYLKSRNKPYLN
jgi:hypothetical protein